MPGNLRTSWSFAQDVRRFPRSPRPEVRRLVRDGRKWAPPPPVDTDLPALGVRGVYGCRWSAANDDRLGEPGERCSGRPAVPIELDRSSTWPRRGAQAGDEDGRWHLVQQAEVVIAHGCAIDAEHQSLLEGTGPVRLAPAPPVARDVPTEHGCSAQSPRATADRGWPLTLSAFAANPRDRRRLAKRPYVAPVEAQPLNRRPS